ncbi:MAG: hypothetical protein A2Y42_00605 [Omnitrophica WOR_2 bacterium GWB2_45_9]|nr:twin-arginine translocase TatA/TatE family subunit [Candidatus Omnitrophota bacterium]OGX11699.1 MAG: hypothetical protein A2Y42_00605 [Omnitrophica WOR_2 bacterium GWB2_45_9]OGX47111.1 MAG: hypothetical protein A2216_01810 [Omnitrophica WOR_2 bacterium RIFOXYA2_FULL_45_12]OGX60072.1 MAG: hypothetical protein A2471_03590 [Omnitrophica WOR_2 bacterium RIFOXYC2_FULL_45_15]HBU08951.1 twin-arginine translocase TatA/TatE family subunit [Candidatus Omnitrophota bacterium]
MFGLGTQELIWIFLILLLLFGAAKLPGLGKAIGKTISEFKKGMREVESTPEKEEKKETNPQITSKK